MLAHLQDSLQSGQAAPWRALGVVAGPGAEWFYCFEIAGFERRFRGALMCSPPTMLAIDPDADRWRSMFPHPTSRGKFDHLKAGGFLMRECWAAELRRNPPDAPETETIPNTPKHRGNTRG